MLSTIEILQLDKLTQDAVLEQQFEVELFSSTQAEHNEHVIDFACQQLEERN